MCAARSKDIEAFSQLRLDYYPPNTDRTVVLSPASSFLMTSSNYVRKNASSLLSQNGGGGVSAESLVFGIQGRATSIPAKVMRYGRYQKGLCAMRINFKTSLLENYVTHVVVWFVRAIAIDPCGDEGFLFLVRV